MALGPTDHSNKGAHRGAFEIVEPRAARRVFEPVWRYCRNFGAELDKHSAIAPFLVQICGQFLEGTSFYISTFLICLFYKNLPQLYHAILVMSMYFRIFRCVFYNKLSFLRNSYLLVLEQPFCLFRCNFYYNITSYSTKFSALPIDKPKIF
jgi:hypothetical protein